MPTAPTVATIRRRAWVGLILLVCASLFASCGSGADEAAYDADGRLVCPDLPEAAEPTPQIYLFDLESPELMAEVHGVDDLSALSIVRRDVVERTNVHFGFHRGGVAAPVRVWSNLSGVDAALSVPTIAVDGQPTTNEPCELQRFDALAGFYDYTALFGSERFEVVGASDDFLTALLGEPRDAAIDSEQVASLIDDFAGDRSLFTNRRYVLLAGAVVAALVAFALLGSVGRRGRSATTAG